MTCVCVIQVTPHTYHLTPHTSHLTPHTSHLTSHTSNLTPHTSHLTPHTSHLTPHTDSEMMCWNPSGLNIHNCIRLLGYDYTSPPLPVDSEDFAPVSSDDEKLKVKETPKPVSIIIKLSAVDFFDCDDNRTTVQDARNNRRS